MGENNAQNSEDEETFGKTFQMQFLFLFIIFPLATGVLIGYYIGIIPLLILAAIAIFIILCIRWMFRYEYGHPGGGSFGILLLIPVASASLFLFIGLMAGYPLGHWSQIVNLLFR